MKDIFSTNLCWRNCESCPPEELTGDIILTNGTAVCEGFYVMSFIKTLKWYKLLKNGRGYERICQEDLGSWWWTDIAEKIREEFGE